ncbi:MAG: hypothetical protein ACOZJX_18675 [Pseudomonadota bacterium]
MDGLGVLTLVGLFSAFPLLGDEAQVEPRLSIDAYAPLHADRQLQLTHLDLSWWRKDTLGGRLTLRLGLGLTRATGSIEQWRDDTPGAAPALVTLDSPAWGAGVTASARWQARAWGGGVNPGGRLSLDAAASAMAYDRRFPAGGLHYDGMFRFGPTIEWDLADGALAVGARWMHLSNGRGLTPRNPSYEGQGMVLAWQWRL